MNPSYCILSNETITEVLKDLELKGIQIILSQKYKLLNNILNQKYFSFDKIDSEIEHLFNTVKLLCDTKCYPIIDNFLNQEFYSFNEIDSEIEHLFNTVKLLCDTEKILKDKR